VARNRNRLMTAFRKVLRLAHNRWVNLITGIVLLVTALFELSVTAIEDALGFTIEVHHGVLIYAIVQVVRALHGTAEGVEGLEKVADVVEPQGGASPHGHNHPPHGS
jgi:hypothetical protein